MRFAPLLVAGALAGSAASQDVFPYDYHIHDFDNGLRLVSVPLDQPRVVCTYIIVSVGSRHEVEEGKSGFAHFFEHMMFRGTKNHTPAEQAAFFKSIGAGRNAYTTDDYTAYHTTFSAEDLEDVLRWEADRFRNLQYGERVFRTEAMAVRGEYNKNYANPINKLLEQARDTAFDEHTYQHTTMGFLRDINAMPRQYEYSQQFFDRFYRPEYTTILVVGDVDPDAAREMVARHWGDWERGGHTVEIPGEPPQNGPRTTHVEWSTPTQPWSMVAFKGPAFDPAERDMPAVDVLMELAFGENSDLYQELYVERQIVDVLSPYAPDHADPFLISILARARKDGDLAEVNRRILATCERFRDERVGAGELDRVKSAMRYGFAATLTGAESIAGALAGYVARTRTPETVNEVYRTYASVTAEDVRAMARKYLVADRRTIATLAHGPAPSVEAAAEEARHEVGPGHVLMPSDSPLVDFRLLFRVGAAMDPGGKEGLANLTARMLVGGGTEERSYTEIVEALFPMAASVSASVDKDMTVIGGTVHRDNVEAYYGILREMLTRPAFATEDFERVKGDVRSAIDVGLRRSDIEETGKEVMYEAIYGADHPYGHLDLGHLDTLEGLSREDVRAFFAEHFHTGNLVLGLAGDYSGDLPRRILADLPGGEGGGYGELPVAPEIGRSRMTIVEKPGTLATGMHFGFPIDVRRGDPDWVALWLVRSWLGEHRSENSHLYQRLREVRGLNYGDYAYIEHFPHGGAQFQPPPNVGRRSQVFQVWIRPVLHENAPFALKAAWYEVRELVENGLTREQFEATRDYLGKYVNLLVATQDRRLGYALDSGYYGIGEFTEYVRGGLAELTLEEVNAAIRRHLRADRLQFVAITDDAAAFRTALLEDEVTPITYQSPPGEDVLAEDAIIEKLELPLRSEDVEVVPIDGVFAR